MRCQYGNSIFIEALVVPVVCAPLPDQRPKFAKFHYPHLKKLFLSDFSNDTDMEIDILVGGDYYWSFISGKIIRGDDGESPVALNTRIGWVLSGPSSHPQGESYSMVTVNMSATTDDQLNTSGKLKKVLLRSKT